MTAIEGLTLRVRETQRPVTQLHITAPTDLICQMIDDFEARGETAEIGCDDFGNCEHVRFGLYITVHVDDALPAGSFQIVIKTRQRDRVTQ